MEQNNYIWNSSIDEIVMGYKENKDSFVCTFCGREFIKGQIYTFDVNLYDAYGAVNYHSKKDHGSAVDYLLAQASAQIGITNVQQQILRLMSEGKDDNAISHAVGIAQSTVRNHRFKLREKEKQAKLFLALMQSLEEKTKRSISQTDAGFIKEIHPTATMVDDRYNITEEEREKVIKTYLDGNGALLQFPAKEKKKIVLLREIVKNFKSDQMYSENEVNIILERIYNDYATIRRALIEYGFLDRSEDCSVYRVKE
jgi:DNA-binding CsgD family transcriptional regulator